MYKLELQEQLPPEWHISQHLVKFTIENYLKKDTKSKSIIHLSWMKETKF